VLAWLGVPPENLRIHCSYGPVDSIGANGVRHRSGANVRDGEGSLRGDLATESSPIVLVVAEQVAGITTQPEGSRQVALKSKRENAGLNTTAVEVVTVSPSQILNKLIVNFFAPNFFWHIFFFFLPITEVSDYLHF
jgi:hypothetical protein